ncbi:agouti-related protein-like [Dunckerocampus dactyliophorus]|uniref:agouti-related protein-like n=1 Tax=Dunckerocampus dactyliophorus TaxID=161453 RepID=UPI0024051008|nr:agouti-related protein-like [Dunckerocampus dactyliophorus]
MKLPVLCFCLLHLAFVSGGLLTRNDLQSGGSNLISRRAGHQHGSRHRTLFARRGQYEQQKLQMMRPRGMPAVPKDNTPTKAPPKPATTACSQLGQSCIPHQGCCEPCSACHCHFFKAICFCRRINMQCLKNT